MSRLVIVVEKASDWGSYYPSDNVVTAQDYLKEPIGADDERTTHQRPHTRHLVQKQRGKRDPINGFECRNDARRVRGNALHAGDEQRMREPGAHDTEYDQQRNVSCGRQGNDGAERDDRRKACRGPHVLPQRDARRLHLLDEPAVAHGKPCERDRRHEAEHQAPQDIA
jgi:hypothetical protein